MDGILPIYKPAGITSYDVIRQVKRMLLRGQKVGHAGTLDPFAEGVLLLLLGKATKRFDEIQSWRKTYLATARLGYFSDTLDVTGQINKVPNLAEYSTKVQDVANRYVGTIEQVVPSFSAAKYKGKPLYKYARGGEDVPPKSKKVTVYSIKVLEPSESNGSNHRTEVQMRVECGSGTYIRQLSYDIFHTLGIESYLTSLTRERVGEITTNDCNRLDAENALNIWQG